MEFYIANLMYAFISIVQYMLFRDSVYTYLRLSGKSKSYIRKHRKGFANYWLFRELHKEFGIGKAYGLNICVLKALGAFTLVSVLLGYLDAMKIPVTVLSVLLCAVLIPAIIHTFVWHNREQFGSAFVLWAKYKTPGPRSWFHSSVFDIAMCLVPVLFVTFNFSQL